MMYGHADMDMTAITPILGAPAFRDSVPSEGPILRRWP